MEIPCKGRSLNKGNSLIREAPYRGKSLIRTRMKGDLVYILVSIFFISTDCYQYCYQYSYVLVLVLVLILLLSLWLLLSLGLSLLVVRSGTYCIVSLHITMIIIRIIMIIIRIMIIITYCITYDMVSITSCSALFDYVLLYVVFLGSGILRYGCL